LKSKNINPKSVVNLDLGYSPTRKSVLWKLIFKLPRKLFPPYAVQGDWDTLPFKSENFDISVLLFSAGLWAETNDLEKIMNEIMRVTKESIFINGAITENIQYMQELAESRGGFRMQKLERGYELKR